MLRRLLATIGLIAALSAPASAATLYISEFSQGVSPSGSNVSQALPQAPVTDQTVALSGASAASTAFNSKTHFVMLTCDEGCSVVFSSSSPVATTGNNLLQQGVPYIFGTSPGWKVAAIANAAGNTGGSGGGENVTIVGPLGQAAMAASLPVAIASDQTNLPENLTQLAGNAVATGNGVSGTGSLRVNIASDNTAFPVTVTGNVASGGADSGNPVKVGGVYNSTLPTLTTGQRGDNQLTAAAELRVGPSGRSQTPVDANSNTSFEVDFLRAASDTSVGKLGTVQYAFNGTTWDRLRAGIAADAGANTGVLNTQALLYNGSTYDRQPGNTSGTFAQGNVASGAADAGNPVKIGCVFNTGLAAPTNGQRVDCQAANNGITRVIPYLVNTALADAASNTQFLIAGAATTGVPAGTSIQVFPLLYNGATWDRPFTCPSTAAVSVTAASTTQIVALSGSTVIRVCSVSLGISLTGTVNVVTGTGSNCGTPTTISNAIPLTTGFMWQQTAPAGGSLFRSTAGGEICIAAATGNVTGFITYAQY